MRVYIIALMGTGLLLAALPERAAMAQLTVPELPRSVPRLPPPVDVERRVRRNVGEAVKDAGEVVDVTVVPLAKQLADQADAAIDAVTRVFVDGSDPGGNRIELDTVVVIVDTSRIADLDHGRVVLVSRRDMASLGLTMLTLRKSAGGTLPDLVDELRRSWPDAIVDFNHVYNASAMSREAGPVLAAESAATTNDSTDRLRIGIIDSAVQTDHVMLRRSHIITADFAIHEGARPLTHGTAVASLMAESSGNEAVIYSAGVFFQLPGQAPGATTEGLVAALDWLMTSRVPVINMSLSGPPNSLLESVVLRATDKGHYIVAAVGNNGPSGEPLYPGAYEPVVAVTAVDRKNKIFRYANRGEHVDFAARGVNVRIADSTSGGLRIESGTSMASPHVAVVIARMLRMEGISDTAVYSWLVAGAEDLGRKGFDSVYGHGLITQAPVIVSAD